jgi:hypothetical protein
VDIFDGATTVDPATCIRERKIVIVDISAKVYGETIAKIAGVMFKKGWADALHRRWLDWDGDPDDMPLCGVWADEAQNFVTESDLRFVDTCRSTRGYLVYATQNLPGFQHELGGNEKARHIMDTLLGNLTINIGFQNKCHATGEWFQNTIGKELVWRKNFGQTYGQGNRVANANVGFSLVEEFQCPARAFFGLQCGGERSKPRLTVEGILFMGGREFKHNGKRFLKLRIRQGKPSPNIAVFLEHHPEARNWARHVNWWEIPRAFAFDRNNYDRLFLQWGEHWVDSRTWIGRRLADWL